MENRIWLCPARSITFTGRKDELQELHNQLNNSTTVITQTGTAISGLGGIGKSELAKVYALKYYENDYYHHAIWIDAENEGSMRNSFHKLA